MHIILFNQMITKCLIVGVQERWGYGYSSGRSRSVRRSHHLTLLRLSAGQGDSSRSWSPSLLLQDEQSTPRVQSARSQGQSSELCLPRDKVKLVEVQGD